MRKVWWRCPDGHTWQTPVAKRAQGSRGETGCPECANRRTAQRLRARWATRTVDDPLPLTHPAVAAQLDPDRNPGVDLERITAGSQRKLWWRCPSGHHWEASVNSRTQGSGCPVCSGLQPGPLAVTHPAVAAELDPDHNRGVTADQVDAGSHGLLWWRCLHGHRWQDTPSHRANGAGCPICHPTRPPGVRRTCAWSYDDPADPRAGTHCRGAAVAGSDWCVAHQPAGAPRCTAPGHRRPGGDGTRPAALPHLRPTRRHPRHPETDHHRRRPTTRPAPPP